MNQEQVSKFYIKLPQNVNIHAHCTCFISKHKEVGKNSLAIFIMDGMGIVLFIY